MVKVLDKYIKTLARPDWFIGTAPEEFHYIIVADLEKEGQRTIELGLATNYKSARKMFKEFIPDNDRFDLCYKDWHTRRDWLMRIFAKYLTKEMLSSL